MVRVTHSPPLGAAKSMDSKTEQRWGTLQLLRRDFREQIERQTGHWPVPRAENIVAARLGAGPRAETRPSKRRRAVTGGRDRVTVGARAVSGA